nr:MAG TPA: Protein of unknown function (DUF1492) [Bacteriophage sp.]
MVLNRENLNKYMQIEQEISRINRKLEYYATHPIQGSHGVVKGSMNRFPYAECHFVVGAPDVKSTEERHKKVQNLVIALSAAKEKYENFQLDIDIAIESVDDLEMRQILEYKYIERISDSKIADILGYDRSTISKKLDRFFEKQVSHNSHCENATMVS